MKKNTGPATLAQIGELIAQIRRGNVPVYVLQAFLDGLKISGLMEVAKEALDEARNIASSVIPGCDAREIRAYWADIALASRDRGDIEKLRANNELFPTEKELIALAQCTGVMSDVFKVVNVNVHTPEGVLALADLCAQFEPGDDLLRASLRAIPKGQVPRLYPIITRIQTLIKRGALPYSQTNQFIEAFQEDYPYDCALAWSLIYKFSGMENDFGKIYTFSDRLQGIPRSEVCLEFIRACAVHGDRSGALSLEAMIHPDHTFIMGMAYAELFLMTRDRSYHARSIQYAEELGGPDGLRILARLSEESDPSGTTEKERMLKMLRRILDSEQGSHVYFESELIFCGAFPDNPVTLRFARGYATSDDVDQKRTVLNLITLGKLTRDVCDFKEAMNRVNSSLPVYDRITLLTTIANTIREMAEEHKAR